MAESNGTPVDFDHGNIVALTPWNRYVYETKDYRYVAVGAIEEKYYHELLRGLGLSAAELPEQMDRRQWPTMKEKFVTKSRDEWTETFTNVDTCVTPVLSPRKASTIPITRYAKSSRSMT